MSSAVLCYVQHCSRATVSVELLLRIHPQCCTVLYSTAPTQQPVARRSITVVQYCTVNHEHDAHDVLLVGPSFIPNTVRYCNDDPRLGGSPQNDGCTPMSTRALCDWKRNSSEMLVRSACHAPDTASTPSHLDIIILNAAIDLHYVDRLILGCEFHTALAHTRGVRGVILVHDG